MDKLIEEYVDNSKRLRQAIDHYVAAIQTSMNKSFDGRVALKIHLTKGNISQKVEIVTEEFPRID